MPGANTSTNAYADYDDDRPPSTEQVDGDTDSPKPKKPDGKDGRQGQARDGKGGGWLGGILTKLSLRPPNQMILPDDKNPTIVWDDQKKRWRNLDGDSEETDLPPPPPPKMADLVTQLRSSSPPLQPSGPPSVSPSGPSAPSPSAPSAAPLAAPVSNIFKMQKGRHIKKSYVDVFNPSGAATRALPPAAEVLGPAPPPPPTTYFVPAPPAQSVEVSIPPSPTPTPPLALVFEGGIYDPSQMPSEDDQYRSGI